MSWAEQICLQHQKIGTQKRKKPTSQIETQNRSALFSKRNFNQIKRMPTIGLIPTWLEPELPRWKARIHDRRPITFPVHKKNKRARIPLTFLKVALKASLSTTVLHQRRDLGCILKKPIVRNRLLGRSEGSNLKLQKHESWCTWEWLECTVKPQFAAMVEDLSRLRNRAQNFIWDFVSWRTALQGGQTLLKMWTHILIFSNVICLEDWAPLCHPPVKA